jgi:hypothetical protein
MPLRNLFSLRFFAINRFEKYVASNILKVNLCLRSLPICKGNFYSTNHLSACKQNIRLCYPITFKEQINLINASTHEENGYRYKKKG